MSYLMTQSELSKDGGSNVTAAIPLRLYTSKGLWHVLQCLLLFGFYLVLFACPSHRQTASCKVFSKEVVLREVLNGMA